MNKTVKLLLILSIAVNAIWLIGAASGWFSFGKTAGAAAQAKANASGALSPKVAREMKALLTSKDAAALRDKLRALGLPEDVVRNIVETRIWSRYTARYRELNEAERQAALQRQYWRTSPREDWGIYTSDKRSELTALRREAEKQISQILGKDDETPGYSQMRYPFLSSDKADQLSEIQYDYYQMRDKVRHEVTGFPMPGDDAKLKLIDEEYKRDVDALLTPDEKAANDLRNSTTAYRLQRAFGGFDGTQEEYMTIFALQQEMDDKYTSNSSMLARMSGANMTEYYRERTEAQKEVDAQIKETLGDARYAEYVRGQREDYQTLLAAAQRFNLGADTVAQTYQVRDDTANEAKRISNDRSLSTEQKNEAFAALAEQATGQIRATLGDDVGNAYIDNALVWLKNLPKGGTVTISSRGNVIVEQPKPKKP